MKFTYEMQVLELAKNFRFYELWSSIEIGFTIVIVTSKVETRIMLN